MSCGLENKVRGDLYQGLLLGMHAIAQPLTLLQSRLYLTLVERPEHALLVAANEDLDNLCVVFRLTQQLIYLDNVQPIVEPTLLSRVLEALIEDAETVFAGSGLHLVMCATLGQEPAIALEDMEQASTPLPAMPSVQIDLARTRTALSQLLSVAREAAAPDSSLSCQVRCRDSWVELVLEVSPPALQPGGESGRAEPIGSVMHKEDAAGGERQGPESAVKELSELACLLLTSACIGLRTQQARLSFCNASLRTTVNLPVATGA